MNKYAVISDSACDLPAGLARELDIDIVPFKFSFDKTNKLTDGVDLTADGFYSRLQSSSAMPKTYFPTVGDYVDVFKARLERGQDIICLCLSSKLSKSYASASNAKKILSYTYPDNKIMVFDTLSASAGQYMLTLDAVKLSGSTGVEAVLEKLEAAKKTAMTLFTVASLEQLSRGGRMSGAAAVFGGLLKINPIIYLSKEGALASKDKAIGRSKALAKIKSLIKQEIGAGYEKYDFITLHTRAPQEASVFSDEIKAAYGINPLRQPLELGAIIGMHTGPTVIGAAFKKKI